MMPSTQPPDSQPVFIVGAARSGTTLLQYMLRSHPGLSLPTGESHFIVPLHRMASQFGDLQEPQNIRKVLQEMQRRSPSFLASELHGITFDIDAITQQLAERHCHSVAAIIDGLFRLNAEGEGKQRWGDKTPYYALHLPLLMEMFPRAQIIHIIRDGRDCALSMLKRRYDLGIYNIYDAAFMWQHYVDSARRDGKQLGPGRYFEFRYEDLLTDPALVLKQICAFLGEPYDESLLEFRKPAKAGKTPLLQKPVQKDNAEKWRHSMKRRERRVFEAVAGETLAAIGYPCDKGITQLPKIQQIAYRIHSRILGRINRTFIRTRKK